MARIAFVHAAADAEQELGKIHLDAEVRQSLKTEAKVSNSCYCVF